MLALALMLLLLVLLVMLLVMVLVLVLLLALFVLCLVLGCSVLPSDLLSQGHRFRKLRLEEARPQGRGNQGAGRSVLEVGGNLHLKS